MKHSIDSEEPAFLNIKKRVYHRIAELLEAQGLRIRMSNKPRSSAWFALPPSHHHRTTVRNSMRLGTEKITITWAMRNLLWCICRISKVCPDSRGKWIFSGKAVFVHDEGMRETALMEASCAVLKWFRQPQTDTSPWTS